MRAGRSASPDRVWKYFRYESCALAPPLDENSRNTVNAMLHPTANPVSCKPGGRGAYCAESPELNDSAHQENAALRFWTGQYNLKHSRARGHVPTLHEACHLAGAGQCPLEQ